MASPALNVLSGIAAAAAGLAGDKVPKSGVIPGLDLTSIIPALLGGKTGGIAGVAGTVASLASKSGLLKNVNIAELAGSLLSMSSKASAATEKTSTPLEGIAGLAQMIAGNGGSAANLVAIAGLASKLAGTTKDEKGLTKMAGDLGKSLSSKFGVSLEGAGTALKTLDKTVEQDTKGQLFKAILKGLG